MKGRGRGYIPIGYKLMLSYLLFIIVPVLVVGAFAASTLVNSAREQTRVNISGTLKQIKDNIAYKVEDARRISELLYGDTTLIRHLKHYEEGWVSYEVTTGYLKPKLEQAIQSTSQRIWLSVFLHNDTLPEMYYSHVDSDPLVNTGSLYEVYHMERIQNEPWYIQFPPEKYGETMQWRQIDDDAKFGRISMLRRILDNTALTQLEEIGFVRIAMRMSDIFESVDHRKIGDESAIYIVDDRQRIMRYSGTDVRLAGHKLWSEIDTANHLVIKEELPGLELSLITLIPNAMLQKDAQSVLNLTIIVCLICFIVCFLAGVLFSRSFSKRVTKLVSVLETFRGGEFHKRIQYRGNDEFAQIATALNAMGEHTEGLIREVYMSSIQKKEAELESLQAQINPHFLYNTLSSISRLAKFGELDKLQRMVLDLAKFYRLSLNEGRTVIPVYKELEQAAAYVAIQKIKYGERMQVMFDIEPGIHHCDTVKLILQPFIENVLEHAWCGDRIHMRIAGYRENEWITFKIIDDGVGFRRETLSSIFDPEANLNVGYGIRNVDQRIKLHYGKQYGVWICSRPGIGTTVMIRIPAIQGGVA